MRIRAGLVTESLYEQATLFSRESWRPAGAAGIVHAPPAVLAESAADVRDRRLRDSCRLGDCRLRVMLSSQEQDVESSLRCRVLLALVALRELLDGQVGEVH